MKQIVIFLMLIALLPASLRAEGAAKFTFPMHPHYIADAPGSCPICGMELVPVVSASGGSTVDSPDAEKKPKGKGKILYYRHPMGKPDTSPVPKKDEMGMDYIPVYENEAADATGAVTIAPETIQNMGVQIIPAQTTVFGRTVRAFGAVTENTRLQTVVSSRVEGWIEDLAVTAVGDTVKKGDLLFRLYSPDLVAAQQDFLAALGRGSSGRITSSARRLESLGVQKPGIEALRNARKIQQRMPFYAEHDGVVAQLNVREGTYVKPGDTITVVQDYSSVWVRASVAEKDLAMISAGQPARLEFPSLPGREISGTVDYVHPTVDPQSRTGQVRLVLKNPDGALRPGAYADVVFNVERQKRLAVPSEAILRDSRGAYVVAALGNGRFQPRRIETGITSEGRTEIIFGLRRGENVVVSGQFLIDSESALRESFRKLHGAQTALAQLDLSPTELSLLDHYVDAALYLHESLMNGSDITPDHLDAALRAGGKLKPRFGDTRLWPLLQEATNGVNAAQTARSRRDLETALSGLTAALKPWLLEGRPAHYKTKGLKIVADRETGRLWLQRGGKLQNPYNGQAYEMPWPEESPARATAPKQPEKPKRAGTGHEHH